MIVNYDTLIVGRNLRSLPKLHHFVFVCRELPFPLLTHEYQPAFAAVESMFFFLFLFFVFFSLFCIFIFLVFHSF